MVKRSLWLDRIHNDDQENKLSSYNQVLEKKQKIVEFRFRHKECHYVWLRDEINIDEYINDLLDIIVESINLDKDIEVEKNMDSVPLVVGQAIPCGLLLNEMITNFYKHAFKDLDEGIICINLKEIRKELYYQ